MLLGPAPGGGERGPFERGRGSKSQQLKDIQELRERCVRLEGDAPRRFGELAAVGLDQGGYVRIGGGAKPELPLQIDLSRRVIEQVGAANNFCYALIGVVDHDGEQVCEPTVAALQDEVAGGEGYVLPEYALYTIHELHESGVDPQAYAQVGVRLAGSVPAMTRVARLVREVLPAAGARKGKSAAGEIIERRGVGIVSIRLPEYFAVPLESECCERREDALRGARNHARTVDILHPHEPAAPMGARIAGCRGIQGPEVQIARGRGCESSDVSLIGAQAADRLVASDTDRRGRRTAFRGVRAAPELPPTAWPPAAPRDA